MATKKNTIQGAGIKPIGKNVRICNPVYQTVLDHVSSRGIKIGKFFEMAAMDRVISESTKPLNHKSKK